MASQRCRRCPATAVRRPAVVALAAAVLLLAGAGCGNGENGEPGRPTTTPAAPGDPRPGADQPDPDRDLSALRCQSAPRETLDATRLEGLPYPEAEERAEARGCSTRIVEEDGEALAVTDDLRPDRVNVAVESGEVTAIIGAY